MLGGGGVASPLTRGLSPLPINPLLATLGGDRRLTVVWWLVMYFDNDVNLSCYDDDV